MEIECAGYKRNSCDDGPGVRDVLFLQGCSQNCPGCHNKREQLHGKGKWMEVDRLADIIENTCRNKKITISGGEPLEQKEALYELGCVLKQKGFNICIYTGWEWLQIPGEVLEIADIIKAGPYRKEMKQGDLKYVGSSNQIMKRKNSCNVWENVDLVG